MLNTYTLPEGVSLPKEIQGGAFYNGDLYLASNIDDSVFKVRFQVGNAALLHLMLRCKLDRTQGQLTQVLSDVYPNHEYEMEGLDFWDLTEKGLGMMHM